MTTESENQQSRLRQLQLVEKEILLDVVKICDQYHLRYFLSSGTLLGAVRHKGFIPWDDDIDIEMPIEDYRRFLEIAQDSLGEGYFVQTFMTEPNFQFAFARIRKNNTTYVSPYIGEIKMNHGIWIDIFPIIPVNPGISLFLTQKWLTLCNYVQIEGTLEVHKDEFRKLLGTVGILFLKAFSCIPMKYRQKLHGTMLNVVFNANAEKCSHMGNVWGNITGACPKEIYRDPPKMVEFEGVKLKAHHDYIKYLEIKFGDYMTLPPEEKRRGHGKDMIIEFDKSYETYLETADLD